MKFVIVGFDGLRPEMITAERMPHLHRFTKRAVVAQEHRCCFPSETYVNLPSLVTGSNASGHGLVGNSFHDPWFDKGKAFDCENFAHMSFRKAKRAGGVYDVPSLGEMLGRAGRHLAVLTANSDGCAYQKHHAGPDFGHLVLSCWTPETGTPSDEVARIVERFGPAGQYRAPDLIGATYLTDIFLDHLARGALASGSLPDVTIVWFAEPDTSYHKFGLGSPEALNALADADNQFGRILDWWERQGADEEVQLLAVSDHAHITQAEPFDLRQVLRDAGFSVGESLADDSDILVLPGYCARLYLREPALAKRVAPALMEREEIGMLFSHPRNEVEGIVEGCFSASLVFADHGDAPDLYAILRTSDESDVWDMEGTCTFDAYYGPGSGMHGGLHRKELTNTLIAAGSIFREGHDLIEHTGIVDIAPTLLHGFDLESPEAWHGRVLQEALARATEAAPEPTVEHLETGSGPFRQTLSRVLRGPACYLDGGGRVT